MIDNEKIKEQADYFGTEDRLCQLMEECGELIQAANKYRRHINGDDTLNAIPFVLREDMREEMADVSLLIKEICYLLDIEEDGIARMIEEKLSRTEVLLWDD